MSYYLKKFWKKNLMVVLVQLAIYSLTASQALVQIRLFQSLIDWDARGLLFWVTVNTAVWVVFHLLEILRTRLRAAAVRSMNHQVRRDMAATLLSKSHQDYHAQESGEYLSWFTNGVERIESTAWNAFFDFAAYLSMVVTSLVALASIHWSLLLISLVVAIILTATPELFTKKMERLGAACAREQAFATGKLKELLGGFDVLRFFGRSDRFIQGIDQASEQMEKPKYEQACQQEVISSGVLGILQTLINVGTILFVALLSLKGSIIQSALAGTGNLCCSVNNGVQGITSLRLSIASSRAYFQRITVHDDGAGPQPRESLGPVRDAITVENVNFHYNEKPVLQDLSLQFKKGGKYALTGPSGCGKSTFLKLLLGWLPDYTGSIRFDGKDARNYTPEQLQQQMSYIEQNVFLFNTTIRENITLGEAFSEEDLQKALRDSALARDLSKMPEGLDTIVGEEGSNLSGGQKQRIAIARALIHHRSILLVDEGTSALDRKNADIVEESLLSNPDLTLILVSHHLTSERKKQFDQVYDLQMAATNHL